MTPTPTPDPPPLRVYALYLDGVLLTNSLAHGDDTGPDLDQKLNHQFHAWLEMTAPGAYEAGRVTGIRFADLPEQECDITDPPSGPTHWHQ